ncbi:MAG: HAMP domain-containing histidine kinase [Clostridiales bacterium]|nr:HAMP domain-containing histidine kinase [Clostridiales bacterium]
MRRGFDYLKSRRALVTLYLLALAVIFLLGFLARQDAVYVRYEAILVSFSFACILLVDGARYRRERRRMAQIRGRTELLPRELPDPPDGLTEDYDALIRALARENERLKTESLRLQEEQKEYYTLWMHQIKTPISAMRLLLEGADDERAPLLRQELFKVDQYADLALKFVKLCDISSDLVIERCDLNEIAHEAVKKYSLLFVYSRLSIELGELQKDVPCDRMWLGFILGQLLSNSVKYTRAGGVRIFMDGAALVVEDTGIGIRKEDLPRIFEKGYTGYNGRMDNRASGIGLYLVKRAADALGISVSVSSELGKGTRVTLRFPKLDEFSAM